MKLSQADWELLAETPIAVFSLVATADGKVSDRERMALLEIWSPRLARLQLAKDGTHHQVYRYILQERCEKALKQGCLYEPDAAKDLLLKTAAMLKGRMTLEEATFMRSALVTLARDVAKAASGFFGLGPKVTADEQAAISMVGRLLS